MELAIEDLLVNDFVNEVEYKQDAENVNDLVDVLNDDNQVLNTIDSILYMANEEAVKLASD